MDHLGVVSGWIIELPINYGKKFATEEREIFIARMHREEYLVKDIIAPRMETQLTFTCRRDATRRKLRIGRMMRTEIVICIIISRGCYSPSQCNDNAIARIGLRCNYYDQSYAFLRVFLCSHAVNAKYNNFSRNLEDKKYNSP